MSNKYGDEFQAWLSELPKFAIQYLPNWPHDAYRRPHKRRWSYEQREQFEADWKHRFGLVTDFSDREPISAGWYMATVSAVRKIWTSLPYDEAQELVDTPSDRVRESSVMMGHRLDRIEKTYSSQHGDGYPVQVLVQIGYDKDNKLHVQRLSNLKQMRGAFSIQKGGGFWPFAIRQEDNPYFWVALPESTTLPTLRTLRALGHLRRTTQEGTVLLLEWIFGAGEGEALEPIDACLSQRTSEVLGKRVSYTEARSLVRRIRGV